MLDPGYPAALEVTRPFSPIVHLNRLTRYLVSSLHSLKALATKKEPSQRQWTELTEAQSVETGNRKSFIVFLSAIFWDGFDALTTRPVLRSWSHFFVWLGPFLASFWIIFSLSLLKTADRFTIHIFQSFLHRIEVAFLLLTQQPQVCFLAFSKM